MIELSIKSQKYYDEDNPEDNVFYFGRSPIKSRDAFRDKGEGRKFSIRVSNHAPINYETKKGRHGRGRSKFIGLQFTQVTTSGVSTGCILP